MKRARARTTVTRPSSSGWRSASRVSRRNSGSSSRKRTPLCARLASPGRGGLPPPIRPAVLVPVCGLRKGRRRTRPAGGSSAAREWILVTSIASARVSGGRSAGRRRASMVLPEPGGPRKSRLWPPAAATSSARLAVSWPRTSARSGPAATAGSSPSGATKGAMGRLPSRCSIASARPRRGMTGTVPRAAASAALAAGSRSSRSPSRCAEVGDRQRRRAPGGRRRRAPARRRGAVPPGPPAAARRARRGGPARSPGRGGCPPCAGRRGRG